MPYLEEIVRISCCNRGLISEEVQAAVLQQVRYRIGHKSYSVPYAIDVIYEAIRAYQNLENGLKMWPHRPRP